jgi:DNA-binding transcriptional regulator GbsR (MarR family)
MEELKVSKPTVVNALKDLEDNNILIKYQNVNDKRRHDYFINPITAWKGNSYTRQSRVNKIKTDDPRQLNLFNVELPEKGIKPQLDF